MEERSVAEEGRAEQTVTLPHSSFHSTRSMNQTFRREEGKERPQASLRDVTEIDADTGPYGGKRKEMRKVEKKRAEEWALGVA